jgi:hypothetical protein
MIELRADGSIPGPDKYGRVYQIVNLMTGEIGYNMWSSDLPEGDPDRVAGIQSYPTFKKWASDILPVDDADALVEKLNRGPAEYVNTPHTLMVARVRARLQTGNVGDIDGVSIIDDMKEMLLDINGRGARPPLSGW